MSTNLVLGVPGLEQLHPLVGNAFEDLAAQLQAWASGLPTVPGVPTGSGSLFFGTTPPQGFLICDGSAISRGIFSDLFTVIGTTFGAGDGSTTFNIPDLRQQFPIGKAASGTASTLGSTGGAIDHTHTVSGTTGTGTTGTGTTGTGNTGTGTTGTGTTGTGTTGTGTTGDGTGQNVFNASNGLSVDLSLTTHHHSIPGLSVPGLSVPGLSVPSLTIPGLTVPGLSVPGLSLSATSGSNNPPYVVVNFIIKT